jgi:sugar phosphate permease
MDFNNDNDRKWLGRTAFGGVCGFLIGAILKHTVFALPVFETWELVKAAIIPGCTVLALFIVLYLYDRERSHDEH